ncbi:hypothetical protein HELRODRAFT_185323 [Helobdella robusta]|uniref:COP9 signalosome complex subunit 6 n=1 Tax=Helobdella robusta TaxID=6412 RepID=T1FMN8_HELRO|nr:hypothetical protein HELRODRAFT_185323 [Helobdella robusta]ESO10229.1 hypothetical protein HELRODRAFT_185323 [Helobdella robusta]
MASSMDVDGERNIGFSTSFPTGSVSVSLHPLVIMNVSEHWTRVTAQGGRVCQVLGALIGKQKGRNIEIMNSFELVFHSIEDEIFVDREYYTIKEDQFKQIFSDMDFLGWYNTGDALVESDIKVHKQICQINENPVFLKLNPLARSAELPVNIYESVIDLVDKEATMRFVELPYVLATEEAERIGVDHVARVSISDRGEASTAAQHLTAQYSAVKMLHCRVKIILNYLKDMNNGLVPKNHNILREVYSLCHHLPVLNSKQFNDELNTQYNDVSLMTYLGVMTKACNTINQFVTKFNIVNDRQLARRMRGLLY